MAKETKTKDHPYHKVRCSVHGKFDTYKIYKDNEVFLAPADGQVLSFTMAKAIVNLLNYGQPWP